MVAEPSRKQRAEGDNSSPPLARSLRALIARKLDGEWRACGTKQRKMEEREGEGEREGECSWGNASDTPVMDVTVQKPNIDLH